MADRIKGITIEIDGQTTGLKKALGDVTSQSISVQKELTDVNRLLKFDPGNTAALAQKQELLSKQIEITSQKLQGLKNAQSQVDEQFKSGKIGEDQYRAFQREIEFTEASLSKFKTSYQDALNPPNGDSTAPLKGLQEEAEKTKGIFDNMGEYIKRGVGLAIGGDIWDKAKEGIGELITFGGDWQQSLNGLQAQTGATSDEMAQFNEQIEAIYNNNFGESIDDVADSFAQVRQYMQGTDEDLQGVTQNAIAFRDTFGVDISESMRSVQALMKQFGLTSEEAFNLLAQGQQNGLNFSDELFDSINEYSVQFSKMGFSAEDMFNIFASGAQNGAFNLDKVGDSMKELSLRVVDGSKSTVDAFTSIGLNADEMATKFGAGGEIATQAFQQVIQGLKGIDNPLEQNRVGVELFGTQWEDISAGVITNLDSVQGGFDKTKNSMEQINQVKYNTPIEALQGLGRQIETSILLPVSQSLMPTLNDAATQLNQTFGGSDLKSGIESLSQGLGDLIKAIADMASNVLPSLLDGLGWIMDNSNTIATGIIAIGTAMEVFKVASVIDDLIGKFKEAQAVTEGLTVAQWALNVAQEANPIGIVVAAVAGLVAAIVYLWNTNDGFRNAIIGAWEAIANFFTVTIPAAFQTVIDFITNNWAQLLLLIVNPFAGAFALLYSNCDGFKSFIDGFIQDVINFFQTGWESIVTFFTESVPSWLESMGTWFAELPNKIAYGLGEAIGSVIKWGADTYSYLTTNVPLWINSIGTWFSQLPSNIMTWLTNVITNMQTWGSNMFTEATTAATNTYNAIIGWFMQLPSNVATWFTNTVSEVTTWGNNMYTEASTEVTKVITGIETWFSELPSKMLSIGKNIVQGLKDGISSAWDGMKGWIGGLCDSFIDGVKEKMDIHSPSRVMMELGAYTGEGFGLGIESAIGSISKQANAIADAAIPNINSGSYDMGVNYSPIGGNNIGSTGSNLDAILAKMDSLEKALSNMKILMDSKEVGKLVTPSVSNQLAFNNGRRGF